MLQFIKGSYRSPFCHECREDPERCKLAMRYDSEKKYAGTMQELVCRICKSRLRWYWFAKLPLTDKEKQDVMSKPIRPGRAF